MNKPDAEVEGKWKNWISSVFCQTSLAGLSVCSGEVTKNRGELKIYFVGRVFWTLEVWNGRVLSLLLAWLGWFRGVARAGMLSHLWRSDQSQVDNSLFANGAKRNGTLIVMNKPESVGCATVALLFIMGLAKCCWMFETLPARNNR